MNRKALLYLLAALLTFFAVSAVWSVRDILAFRIENGVGFGEYYSPKLWGWLAVYLVLGAAVLIGAAVRFRGDVIAPAAWALAAALLFFFAHRDPFYRDWSEDCWFARLGWILGGIAFLIVKDLLVAAAERIRSR